MKDYIESLKNPADFKSGQMELLPHKLYDKYGVLEGLEENWHQEARFYHPDERESFKQELINTRKEFYSELKEACETYLNDKQIINQQNSDMKEKKTKKSEPKDEKVAKQTEPKEEKKSKKTEAKEEKREPQLVTVNGDKISHAHCFKAKDSDNWFVTAKINGVPLRCQLMQKEDVEAVMNKTMSISQMMEKYYPTKIAPKVSPADYRLPQGLSTPEGDFVVNKFNVYKVDDQKKADFGKYRFYTEVGNHKMSCTASKEDLNAYFDRVTTPTKLIIKNFGDKLGIKEHYDQFRLPEGSNIESNNILINKNEKTNRFQISVNVPDKGATVVKELSYEDRQAYFSKVANKGQLAAKYLNNEITALMNRPVMQRQEKQMNVKR